MNWASVNEKMSEMKCREWDHNRRVLSTLGSSSNNDGRQLRKHHLKSEVALIPSRSVRQMLAIISGVEF